MPSLRDKVEESRAGSAVWETSDTIAECQSLLEGVAGMQSVTDLCYVTCDL